MADLIVKPAYVLGPRDILTVDKFNLLATPIVELALADPVNDQNFFRNGNFYSSFWVNPAGVSCPAAADTTNANYWYCSPQGAAVNFLRSNTVPDQFSLFSAQIKGAVNVGIVEFGQQINGDLSATLRRKSTFSGYYYNGTGLTLSPVLNIYTCNAFNNFNAITLQTTLNLQTGANASWTYTTATIDLSTLANVANGLFIKILLPAGALNDPAKYILFSRLKFQIGEVATEFVDDTSLFVQTPSIDSTALQDGCIARPSLFLQNVIPLGAYVDKSITDPKLADNTIQARSLGTGKIVTTGNTNSTINVTGIPNTTGMLAGMPISGSGIPVGATIATVVSSTAITLSVAASTSVVGVTLTVTAGTSATVGNLGYTPENRAGDTCTGIHVHNQDTVINSSSYNNAAISIGLSAANATNAGYMPAIGFVRPGLTGRAIGLNNADSRFKTVDNSGNIGYLLDTIYKVDTNSYQDGSITLAKLAQSLLNIICPTGMVRLWAGSGVPSGWLFCDGSAVSRVTYSALWAAIGTTWGAGDGASTFNLPDLRGRGPIGYVNTIVNLPAGITNRGYGYTVSAGEENHKLAVGELAGHSHYIDQVPHTHTLHETPHHHFYVNPLGGFSGAIGSAMYSPTGTANTSDAVTNMTMDGNLATLGGGTPNYTRNNTPSDTAHNNMQPFCVLVFCIKT